MTELLKISEIFLFQPTLDLKIFSPGKGTKMTELQTIFLKIFRSNPPLMRKNSVQEKGIKNDGVSKKILGGKIFSPYWSPWIRHWNL